MVLAIATTGLFVGSITPIKKKRKTKMTKHTVLGRRGSLSIEPRGDEFVILNKGKTRAIRRFKSIGAARSYLRGLPSKSIVHASEISRGVPKSERFPVSRREKNLVTQRKMDRA